MENKGHWLYDPTKGHIQFVEDSEERDRILRGSSGIFEVDAATGQYALELAAIRKATRISEEDFRTNVSGCEINRTYNVEGIVIHILESYCGEVHLVYAHDTNRELYFRARQFRHLQPKELWAMFVVA